MASREEYYNKFCKILDILGRRYDYGRVFRDFLTISLCAVHQVNLASRLQDKDTDNEALYMETIEPYSKEELKQFAELFAIIQSHVYDHPYDDLLGRFYTEYITKGQNGQFFTPAPICQKMAQMHGAKPDIENKSVYDPASGSGRLLLEFARVAPNNYFYANDVNMTCAQMTALNFMLNGLRGEVACMNTLSMEWYRAWAVNTPLIGVMELDQERSQLYSEPLEVNKNGGQLSFF